MRTKTSVIAVLLMLFCWILVSSSGVMAQDKGQDLYKTKCAMCHGAEGKGDTKAGQMTQTPDLSKLPWKHGSTQAAAEKTTHEGVGKMPKFDGKLKADEITVVVQYLRKITKAGK